MALPFKHINIDTVTSLYQKGHYNKLKASAPVRCFQTVPPVTGTVWISVSSDGKRQDLLSIGEIHTEYCQWCRHPAPDPIGIPLRLTHKEGSMEKLLIEFGTYCCLQCAYAAYIHQKPIVCSPEDVMSQSSYLFHWVYHEVLRQTGKIIPAPPFPIVACSDPESWKSTKIVYRDLPNVSRQPLPITYSQYTILAD